MSVLDDTVSGLERFLSKVWEGDVSVGGVSMASAGARRRNVLFEATAPDGSRVAAVATIIPTAGMQLMDIEVEASNLRLARAAGVPAPGVLAVCTDPAFVGGPFFVTERVEGETVPRRVLRLIDAHSGLGADLARQCGAAFARLHAVPVERAHPSLVGPGDRTPAAAALAQVERSLAALLQPSPVFELAFRWLARSQPSVGRGPVVIHSDFRNGNMIVGQDGLRAVLDWEGCHLGDAMADVSWMCVRMWRFGRDELEVGGFGHRTDLRAGYEEAGGRWDEDSFHWWKTLGTLRWGMGLAGQARAHLDGSFRSIVMAASGRRVAELEYDALMLLGAAYRGASVTSKP